MRQVCSLPGPGTPVCFDGLLVGQGSVHGSKVYLNVLPTMFYLWFYLSPSVFDSGIKSKCMSITTLFYTRKSEFYMNVLFLYFFSFCIDPQAFGGLSLLLHGTH